MEASYQWSDGLQKLCPHDDPFLLQLFLLGSVQLSAYNRGDFGLYFCQSSGPLGSALSCFLHLLHGGRSGIGSLGDRGYVVTFFATMGAAGYLILTCVEDESKTAARYAGIWLATCGIFPALSINITWMLNNQGGESKKGAGMAMLAIFGQCSSLISTSVFPNKDAPFYTKGCALGCAFTGLIAILALGLHVTLTMENRRRDRVYGEVSEEQRVDVTDGGDQNPHFRYLT